MLQPCLSSTIAPEDWALTPLIKFLFDVQLFSGHCSRATIPNYHLNALMIFLPFFVGELILTGEQIVKD